MATRESRAQIYEILGALGKNPRKVQGGFFRRGRSFGSVDSKNAIPACREPGLPKGSSPRTGRLETYPLSEDSSGKQGLSTPVDTGIDTSDPNLAKVMNAWPTLPEPIRRAMLALIG
jgi:hypothetical protein